MSKRPHPLIDPKKFPLLHRDGISGEAGFDNARAVANDDADDSVFSDMRGALDRLGERSRGPWGPWRFDREHVNLVLEIDGRERYWIDVEPRLDSAAVLDWIAQVARKRWATDEVLANLVRAFDGILCLQAAVCGGGRNCAVKWSRSTGTFRTPNRTKGAGS